MRAALMARLFAALGLLLLAAMPARAISCSVSPNNIAFGLVDVLTNAAYTTSQMISVSCNGGSAGASMRMCLSLEDPNGEAGGIRKAMNGANQIAYDIYTNPGYTQRFSSWISGTGTGIDLPFTLDSTGSYATSVMMYAKVSAGQTSVPGGTPTRSYTESFSGSSRMKFKVGASALPCASMTGATGNASAMSVTIAVPNMCNVTGNALNFGTVNTLSSLIDATTNISVICSNALPFNIGLDNGNYGTSPSARGMGNGANRVNYALYRNSGRTLLWGGTIGSDTLSGTGTGAMMSVPVFGRVPAQSTPPSGTYTDTVVITVTY